jgi:ATP-dependent 26S proteasome regulatory subunit
MDLTQRKLSKQEWEGIEVPVEAQEKIVLKMIQEGFKNVDYKVKVSVKIQPKKRDLIRLNNVKDAIDRKASTLYEFTVVELIEKMLQNRSKGKNKWLYYYYTLVHLSANHLKMNCVLEQELTSLIEKYQDEVDYEDIFANISDVIERNDYLLRYADMALYEHQKRIFSLFNKEKMRSPKLVLYVAPTGTGKTLTPIGLAEKYRIIFVCAARHVGLALAKSAISSGRKIALAFNCEDAEDIRLHFAAAKEFTKNYKTGGIFRVDNSVGDNVEIIISDIQSYTIAMRYMKAFNPVENMITYWDEPTITMDYDSHPFHEIIQQNWAENVVPNIVLSSATLPHEDEIRDVVADYRARFEGDMVSIISADCNNSISLVNKDGKVVVPHTLATNDDYEDMLECVEHCQKSSSLIRYMDLQEIANFLLYVNEFITEPLYKMKNYFESVKDINIFNIKSYYLTLLTKVDEDDWEEIYEYFQNNMRKQFPSNIFVTTKDAYTLTHGPTIYLTKDVEKVAKFYLQQSKIPDSVIEHIQEQVRKNDKICAEIEKLEKTFEDTMAKEVEKDKKMGDEGRMPPEMKQLRAKIERLQSQVQSVSMPEIYVPNSNDHLRKWVPDEKNRDDVFRPEIPDEYVIKLMQLNDVEPFWKLLLLIGIGVFMNHTSVGYVEIMKALAQQQKLLMILATDDYIYGTNYQFCHGYIGKDLVHLTQEKLIQALGRVGRNKQNKKYSVRMRDDIFLRRIFMKLSVKKEADMMNKLFST